jgi:purine-nucleoside phosphorylase
MANIPTPHNEAKAGDFAKTVLMPGDPLRAKYIAETYLENPVLVTGVRNMLGYTGTYKGKKSLSWEPEWEFLLFPFTLMSCIIFMM